MIPLPPPDPALPVLPAQLNGDAMGEVLQRSLPECASGEYLLIACQPRYVRYKPGTNCLVQYDLIFRQAATDTLITTSGHAVQYADERGAALWDGQRLHRLVERTAKRHPEGPIQRAAYIPALRMLVQLYPVDADLPALARAISRGKLRRALHEALNEGATLQLRHTEPQLVRYKPGRKALLRYPLKQTETDALYAKLQADDRGATLFQLERALALEGVTTPPPLAYLPDLQLRVHPAASGQPLARLEGNTWHRWMHQIAEQLGQLHAVPPDGLVAPEALDEARTIITIGQMLQKLLPKRADLIGDLATTIATALSYQQERQAIVHGDFYYDQILVGEQGVVLLDWDEARLGNRLLDVGNFLAHFHTQQLDLLPAEQARTRFLDVYRTFHPAQEHDVALWEAAALFKLAIGPFRRLEPDWSEGIERMLGLAERRLAEHRRQSYAALPSIVDAALPQLELLRDPQRMAVELAREVYGEPVRVTTICVVRHKPGRRCLLRYDLQIGSGTAQRHERLYGKSFASERGPRVYEITRLITAARACGASVQLPEPVGYLPHLKLLLQRAVSGEPITSSLLEGNARLARQVAEALQALHRSGLDLGRCHDLQKELAPLSSRVERLAAQYPPLASSARRCLQLVESASQLEWRWRAHPIHRDFYHDQLLVAGDSLSILDFDDAAMGEPAVDVANFRAHLRLLAFQHTARAETVQRIAVAFSEQYMSMDAGLDPVLVRFLEGATLLRLAEIHLLRQRGRWIAERLLEASRQLLEGTHEMLVESRLKRQVCEERDG